MTWLGAWLGASSSSGGGGGGPVVVTNNVTTAAAIRDHVIKLIRELEPTAPATPRFVHFHHEREGDFEAACAAKGAAMFRRFAVRDTGEDRRPQMSSVYVEEAFVTLEILVAYAQTAKAGPQQALDRDDIADRDRRLIEKACGMNGYANFVGASAPNATPLNEGVPVTRRTVAGVDLLVITQTYRYYRRTIP